MALLKILKPRGGKLCRFLTWLVYGVVAGTGAGILLGIVWVSVDWIITIRSGSHPAWAWVKYIYVVGATMFGIGGAILGAIFGSLIGILSCIDERS
jgi:hypothetical protein